MIAIIDSGSTKADWTFTDGKKSNEFSTIGMNPNFINGEDVIKIINNGIIKNVSPKDVRKIFYFGTGCSSRNKKKLFLMHSVNYF